ncbi:MAG: AAA family ATPase [Nitrospirota bacterium]|nr:MAG: AAA family ATPase [Nitrospirota bacterium]
MENLKIPAALLSPEIQVDRFGFADTSELPALEEPLGQARAVEAIDFGLSMKGPGYNVYASGPVGTGKWAIIRQRVLRLASAAPAPPDWCYVNNFQASGSPRCLSFPASKGRAFKEGMSALVDGLRRDIPAAFESSKYLDARAKIVEERDTKKQALFHEIEEEARARGFGFKEEPVGFSLVPLREGRPMKEEEKNSLSDTQKNDISEQAKILEGKLREFQSRAHALDHEGDYRLNQMDRQLIKSLTQNRFAVMLEHYRQFPEVLEYLGAVEEDMVSNYKDFLPRETPRLQLLGLSAADHKPDLSRYQVNLIVEHSAEGGAPVVDESHPTYPNLIGKIERKAHFGVMFTDFMEIKPGACLQASGGYLILNALDLLRQPFSWDALKRVIKTGSVKIEDPGEYFGFSTTGLKPQPIPVNLKVILLGPPHVFSLLQLYEEDFSKIFKVKADFEVEVPRDQLHEYLYAQFIAQVCREEQLPHFGADAVGRIIRHGMRLAERRDRLSLRLNWIGDLVREAAYWAKEAGRTLVRQEDVETAVTKKRHRANRVEEWVQDEIKEGTLMVDLEGETVGQVNGLSVHLMGDYAFGRPCRITARTFVGSKGVIDIQREVELSGEIHSKGVMTLAGYLAGKFAGKHPFALSASLTFEQTYSEVEGDSAAVAELVAILSSLGEVPVRQYIAVTGSVNQLGEIQPIGGVNEKIEGFFESCKKHGLTGKQGVIIPSRNIKHLALNREVVEASEQGKFTIYGVNRVEEVLELMTGISAGERDALGQYPLETVFWRAAQRLEEMAKIAAESLPGREVALPSDADFD